MHHQIKLIIFSLCGIVLLNAGQSFAQVSNTADYMAICWTSTGIYDWKNPFGVRQEPIGRLGELGIPVQDDGGKLWVPMAMNHPKEAKKTWGLVPVEIGIGGLLERRDLANEPCVSKAFGPEGRLDIVCMKKGEKGPCKIGTVDTKGKFVPIPGSDGPWEDKTPAWHPDGRLVFASNRPGGVGGFDLWECRYEGGSWSAAVPFGNSLNSEGNEIAPYFDSGGKLYFASDGQWGARGYDLFVLNDGELEQLPYPFNSIYDDTGIMEIGKGGAFWVNSDRPMDGFRLPGIFQLYQVLPKPYLAVTIKHSRSGNPMPEQPFWVVGKGEPMSLKTDKNGVARVFLNPGEFVDLEVHKELFDTLRVKSQTLGNAPVLNLVEKSYHQLSLQIHENGAPCKRIAKIWYEQNGVGWDSAYTNDKGFLTRDLLPSTAYKIKAKLEGYPPQEITFSTGKSGKNNYNRSIQFGNRNVEYVRWQVRGADNRPLAGVKVRVYENRSPLGNLSISPTDSGGWGGAALPEGKEYLLYATFDGQSSFLKWKTTVKDGPIDTSNVILTMNELTQGSLLTRFTCPIDPFTLQVGNFDEMYATLLALESHPELRIEIGVHTDSRGSSANNLRRSQEAAAFALDFFKGKGIDTRRLVAKGYGESQILNRCAEGVNCPENEHNANNRVEIRIL